jgi:hypothetical protein
MAISFVGSLPFVGANNGGNVTLTFSNLVTSGGGAATLQQGDLVVCAFATSSTTDNTLAVSSAGWTKRNEHYSNGSTYDTNLAVFYKFMGASPDTSCVFTGPGGASFGSCGEAFAFRGVDPTTPFDIADVLASGTATSAPNPGSVTPSTAGAWPLIVGAGSAGTGAAFTAPTGLSVTTNHFRSGNHAETNDIALGVGIKTDWASGAFDCPAFGGGNASAANSWSSISMALRPEPTIATVNSGSHSHTASSPSVAAKSSVSADSGVHSHAGTGPALTAGSPSASVNSAGHGHAAGSPTVSAKSSVSVNGSSHGASSTSPVLAAKSSATVNGGVHAQAGGSPTLSAKSTLSVSGSAHALSSTLPALTVKSTVAVNSAAHGQAAGSPSMAVVGLVSIDGAGHGHTAEQASLTAGSNALSVADGSHGHAATESGLTANATAAVNDNYIGLVSTSPGNACSRRTVARPTFLRAFTRPRNISRGTR